MTTGWVQSLITGKCLERVRIHLHKGPSRWALESDPDRSPEHLPPLRGKKQENPGRSYFHLQNNSLQFTAGLASSYRGLRRQSAREDVRHLKVDSLEGIDNSSVMMISGHLEGQSGSDHVQRVSTYHCGHTWQHAMRGQWPLKHSTMVYCHCTTMGGR